MKYLSTLVMILALVVTWKWTQAAPLVSVRTHFDLQTDISKVIETAIVQQVSTANNIRFHSLYSETLGPGSVRARFSYTFDVPEQEASTTSAVEGSALLEQDPKSPENWILKKVTIEGSDLVFNEGIVITPTGEHLEKRK